MKPHFIRSISLALTVSCGLACFLIPGLAMAQASVTTLPATDITSASATLHADLDPGTWSPPYAVAFFYGTTTSYGERTDSVSIAAAGT